MTSPTVAVVMCTYNGEKYLRQQLDSILAQSYPIQELIVQDDCSTDATLAILQEYEAKVPFMRVIENTHNLGFNLNFKTACMRATADLIAISDQDDVWMPEKIQKQVQAIGDYNLCFSAHLRGERMETAHIVSSQYAPEALLFAGIAGHTMLVRREFLQREEIWVDKFFYDWSIAVSAYLYDHRGTWTYFPQARKSQLTSLICMDSGTTADSSKNQTGNGFTHLYVSIPTPHSTRCYTRWLH